MGESYITDVCRGSMSGTGLILTLGKSTEHVKTSLLKYSPEYLVLLTSEDFASTARRQLSHWKRQFDLQGEVFVIKDLFTDDSAEHIMTQTLLAIDFMNLSELSPIFLGITGGTMHMAAAAATAAAIADVPVFYVKRPDGNQVVQPNKDVIEMPSLSAFSKLSSIPIEALELFRSTFTNRSGDDQGKISVSDAATIGMPKGFLDYLAGHRILDKIDSSVYKFTYTGLSMVRMLHSNPTIAKLIKAKNTTAEIPDHMYV
jgi:hypothetical protein